MANADADDNDMPPLPAQVAGNKAELVAGLIEQMAEAIEQRIGGRRNMTGEGGPYEASLRLAYDRRLHEAAVAALEVVINHPALKPRQ